MPGVSFLYRIGIPPFSHILVCAIMDAPVPGRFGKPVLAACRKAVLRPNPAAGPLGRLPGNGPLGNKGRAQAEKEDEKS